MTPAVTSPAMSSPSTVTSPLPPLLPILDAFIHRHTNQHGHSHWFPYVPILRRHLRNLIAHSSRPSPRSISKPRSTTQDARIVRDAKWFQTKVLPQCFLRFSQLAADNQHAPLGLLLLSLLARVNSVLEKIVPPPPSSDITIHTLPDTALHSSSGKHEQTSSSETTHASASDAQRDRGTVISREQLFVPSEKEAKKQPSPSIEKTPPEEARSAARSIATSASSSSELAIKERRRGEHSKVDKDKKVKMKKKKKKDKGNDAFSDMFGGL